MNGIPVKIQRKAAELGLETEYLLVGRNRFIIILQDGEPVTEPLSMGLGVCWMDGYAAWLEHTRAQGERPIG